MSTSKKAAAAMRYQLTGANKKSGVNLWRFVFSAVEKGSSQERVFFIELTDYEAIRKTICKMGRR